MTNIITLKVDAGTCIKCKKCVKICLAGIFYQAPDDEIVTQDENSCIICGHCVAACPTDSVIHGNFPEEKVHSLNRSLLPSVEQVELLIRSRRSNRAFSTKAVPKEFLEKIVEAAYRAPTASNLQKVSFTVVTDPEKLHMISSFTINGFKNLIKKLKIIKPLLKIIKPEVVGMIPKFEERIRKFGEGNDLILRNAKAVIFFHTPKNVRFGMQDANLAYQNASLMAESLGVSQFYTGFVCAVKNKKPLADSLGINGEIHAGMALGMPLFKLEKYIDKEDLKVDWIE